MGKFHDDDFCAEATLGTFEVKITKFRESEEAKSSAERVNRFYAHRSSEELGSVRTARDSRGNQ